MYMRVCVHAPRKYFFPFPRFPVVLRECVRLRVRVRVRVRLLLFLRRCCVTIFPSYFPVYISFKRFG